MNNNLISYMNYMKKFQEFDFIRSKNEKIEKCSKLLEESKKINEPEESEKFNYHYSLAELYFYESVKETRDYGI